jgi:hypothetical protein
MMTMPNRPDDEPIKHKKAKSKAKAYKPPNHREAPRPRGRPSLTQGRAQTVQTSLSPSQAAWVASRGVPVAAYLRGLVEEDMEAQESPEDTESAFQRFLVLHADDIAKIGVVVTVGDLVKIGGDV